MSAVTVWSKPACPQCTAVKRALKNGGVDFQEEDLLENPEALAEFIAAGFGSAPIVEADGHDTFAGFQPDAVKAVVESHGTK